MNKININNDNNGNEVQKRSFTPTQVLALGFIGVIFIGAVLLSLPFATVDGEGTNFLDALFTSTSAVCVTGLVVVDTGTYFTLFGQLVILLMIEIGGLGFMTFATLIAIIMGRKITLKERILLQEALNQMSIEGIVRLAKYVIQITFGIQAIAALILAVRWSGQLGWGKSLYYGIFHAISAFNNAGFDLFGNFSSLTGYATDIVTNITIMVLIIVGGLGFLVLSELYTNKGKKLHLHGYVVLKTTTFLIILGTVVIFALEYNNPNSIGDMSMPHKFMAALFQSVTPRTAGFNTINISDLKIATQSFIMVLMFIGASPGSTGGGIKTTTFVAVAMALLATIKGKSDVTMRERTLPRDLIQKAMTITLIALTLILITTIVLAVTEQGDFMALLFEAVSAFGTVGLSLGITTQLTWIGKIAIMFTMYAGRVGILTLAYALAQKKIISLAQIKYPEERILIG